MRGRKFNKRRSRKTFRKGANRTHSKNKWEGFFMRGGIRL